MQNDKNDGIVLIFNCKAKKENSFLNLFICPEFVEVEWVYYTDYYGNHKVKNIKHRLGNMLKECHGP